MSRGALRRVVVSVLVVGLALLPLAAQAAPAGRSARSALVARPWSGWNGWSGATGWLAVLRGLIVPSREKDSPPPGQTAPDPSSTTREGTGIDPHGAPHPVVP